MPQVENRPTRLALKSGSMKYPSRLVLRGQTRPKKPLEDTVNMRNTGINRSFSTKISAAGPKKIRPSVLSKYQSASLTPATFKKDLGTKENEVSTEDLENRIRNALAASARRRADSMRSTQQESALIHSGETSRHGTIKSVKWDPAIISVRASILDQSPASEDKVPNTPQATLESVYHHLEQEAEVDYLFDTLVKWKKKDPRKIQKLLHELRHEGSDYSRVSSPTEAPPQKTISAFSSSSSESKKLDPSAPPFPDISTKLNQPLHNYPKRFNDSQIHLPKRQNAQSRSNVQHNLQAPIWIKTSNSLPAWTQPLQPLRPSKQFPQNLPLPYFQPVPLDPYLFVPQALPVVPQEPRIPSEDGHGRVAHAIDQAWAEAILEKFVRKYPLTGKLKAKPPVPASGRYAAEIQQRLEYILLQAKERKAFEQLLVN